MLYDGFFAKKQEDKVKCSLCPNNCIINEGQIGLCSVRINKDGSLKTMNYGEVTAMAVDPIEKKPLYHFKPGKDIFSIGTFGCNLSCKFCQNYSIAHYKSNSKFISPKELIDICINLNDPNNIGIAFTYNEPTIWYEYVYETSKELKNKAPNLNIILVTNGYIELEPLSQLLPYIDAMNIDLKSFQQDYYKKICSGNLNSVLKTIEQSYKKCHIEITTLLVNGLNDSMDEIEKIASYLGKLDRNIPLHLSRYYPAYKMERPPTEIDVMLKGKDIAKKYLNYVYLGNIGNMDNSTYCPQCGNLLIERTGYFTKVNINQEKCQKCGCDINVVL